MIGSIRSCSVSATISLHLLDVPAAAQRGEVLAHPLHLVVVGAADQEHELGICGAQYGPAVDQAALVEGLAEGERARLRNDRLVQVEERGCAGQGVVFHEPEHRRPPFGVRWGAWVCLRRLSGTPWKSRIVRDRANPVRLLPPRVGPWGRPPLSPPAGVVACPDGFFRSFARPRDRRSSSRCGRSFARP